jgi:hypothetical protein
LPDPVTLRGLTITEWDDQPPEEAIKRALAPLRQKIDSLDTPMAGSEVYAVWVES